LNDWFRALDKPDRTVGFPVDERVGMLAEVLEDQVALANRAAGNQLDRIDTAGIVLDNTDKFFIIRTTGPKRAAIAYSAAR
jgi:hypothetical protein